WSKAIFTVSESNANPLEVNLNRETFQQKGCHESAGHSGTANRASVVGTCSENGRFSSTHGGTVFRRCGHFCPTVFPAGIAAADCGRSTYHSGSDRAISLSLHYRAGPGRNPVVIRG